MAHLSDSSHRFRRLARRTAVAAPIVREWAISIRYNVLEEAAARGERSVATISKSIAEKVSVVFPEMRSDLCELLRVHYSAFLAQRVLLILACCGFVIAIRRFRSHSVGIRRLPNHCFTRAVV